VGLVVSGHNDTALSTATFDNVTVASADASPGSKPGGGAAVLGAAVPVLSPQGIRQLAATDARPATPAVSPLPHALPPSPGRASAVGDQVFALLAPSPTGGPDGGHGRPARPVDGHGATDRAFADAGWLDAPGVADVG
jgi:hypothetical protein